jgi:hypothetical protein
MTQTNDLDERLTDLWNRRNTLSDNEWSELYSIVVAALRKRNVKINGYLKSLAGEEADYIQDFFISKVMATAPNSSNHRVVTPNHLRGFFTNFLDDQLEKEEREPSNPRTQISIDDNGEDEYDAGHQNRKLPEDSRDYDFSPDSVEEVLTHYRLTRQQVTEAAQQFFNLLDEWKQQVLSRHLCPEDEYAVPLSQLQERFPRTATYYKVKQLGVLHSLRTLPQDYHKTDIGRWLSKTLNIKLERDNYQILAVALQILCLVALQLLDD